mgnify:CR=1 FL=1
MRIARTRDAELIRSIATHPKVYPWIVDDGSVRAEDYQPVLDESLIYLHVTVGAGDGIFLFAPANYVTREIHTLVRPTMWGCTAGAARACMRWIFENTPTVRIITQVPVDNPLAIRLSRRVGMTPYGTNRRSFLRHGKLLDIYLFGIDKEQICQPSQSA